MKRLAISVEVEALMRTVREQTEKIMSLRGILSADLMMIINNIEDPGRLADLVGSNLRLKISESQQILEETNPVERLRLVSTLLTRSWRSQQFRPRFRTMPRRRCPNPSGSISCENSLHALQKELGDTDERGQEIEELEKKIKKTKMPKSVRKEAKNSSAAWR
jgi:ATP-dependent Lon protease